MPTKGRRKRAPAASNTSSSIDSTAGKNKEGAQAKENGPPPLDAEGREICFLFMKYGKCRYGNKCKKSHNPPDPRAYIQNMTTVTLEQEKQQQQQQPFTSSRPKLAFSISMTPYPRPPTMPSPSSATASGTAWTESPGRLVPELRPKPVRVPHSNQTAPSTAATSAAPVPTHTPASNDRMDISPSELPTQPSIDQSTATNTSSKKTIPNSSSNAPTAENTRPEIKKKKVKLKKPAKAPSKCLLALLFRTVISPEQLKQFREQRQIAAIVHNDSRINSKTGYSKVSEKSNSHPSKRQKLSHGRPSSSSSYASNSATISGEKIEQWYITNKARLESASRRLMIQTKPTTARQKSQLKTMRKHHWECKTQVAQLLERNQPTSFALKVARERIDWLKFQPYLALMLQAAFEMDIDDRHLPVLAGTLCAQLERNNLSGSECESLLTSWGLSSINARRFTSHLWEVMVAAAGDANVYIDENRRGVGFQVRQMETEQEYQDLKDRLATLTNKPES